MCLYHFTDSTKIEKKRFGVKKSDTEVLTQFQLPLKQDVENTGCPKNGVLTVHNGIEEIIVNVRKMLKKFHLTYLPISRSLKVELNRPIISKYMY
jgi:hypothetical protein